MKKKQGLYLNKKEKPTRHSDVAAESNEAFYSAKPPIVQLCIMGVLVLALVICLFMPTFAGTVKASEEPEETPTVTTNTTEAPTDEPTDDIGGLDDDTPTLEPENLSATTLSNTTEDDTEPTDVILDDPEPTYGDDEEVDDHTIVTTAPDDKPAAATTLTFFSSSPENTLVFYMHQLDSYTNESDDALANMRTPLMVLLVVLALLYVALVSGFIFFAIGGRLATIGRLTMIIPGIVLAIVHITLLIVLARVSNLFPLSNTISAIAVVGIVALSLLTRQPRKAVPRSTALFVALLVAIPLALSLTTVAMWNGTVSDYVPPQPTHGNNQPDTAVTLGPDETLPPISDITSPPLETNRKPGVYTFVLAGTDLNDYHTDVLMVASFDTVNNTLDILSVPRDTQTGSASRVRKINSSYAIGKGNDNDIANGAKQLRNDLLRTFGFAPDYYFIVNLKAFEKLVDAFDGVDYDVPIRMKYSDPTQNLYIDLQKGFQHLDGAKAIQLVRYRATYYEGDKNRIELTQDFLLEFFKQATQKMNLTALGEVTGIAAQYAYTDLAQRDMLWFGEKLLKLQAENVTFHMMPGDYDCWYKGVSYVSVNGKETVKLVNEHLNPYTADIRLDDLDLIAYKDSSHR